MSRETYSALFSVISVVYGSGNDSTTFNLPDLTDRFIQGSVTAGTKKEAGLPNITGRTSNWSGSSSEGHATRGAILSQYANGAFTTVSETGHVFIASLGSINNQWQFLLYDRFDASKSNSIYGKSTTVQPPALTMKFGIYSGVVSKKLWVRII